MKDKFNILFHQKVKLGLSDNKTSKKHIWNDNIQTQIHVYF